ncbi:MAG: serine hydrolase [Thermodesulfobacteriota bacterium]
MKRLALQISLFLFLARCVSASPAQAPAEPLQRLDGYIRTAMQGWKMPGLAIAIVKDKAIVLIKAYGVREVGKQTPVDEHTLFAIGSTTKAMTAAAVGMLVDEKKLYWDDPVTKYLPWFHLPDSWVTREVTIRDLLCHRVGTNAHLPAITSFDREEMLRRFKYVKPYLPFRYQYEYNNIMYTVAGQVVAAVSGMSWEEFVQARILKPLGMTETHPTIDTLWDAANVAPCFCCDLPGRTVGFEAARAGANVAMPHLLKEGEMKVIPWRKYSTIGPAGGELASSINDMAKWLQLQVGKGVYKNQRLLSESTFEEMHTPQMIIPLTNKPLFLKDEPDVHFLAYGFGWRLNDYRGKLMSWHTGGVYGFSTIVGLLPEMNVGVVVLTNVDGSGLAGALMMRIFDAYLAAPERDWSTQILMRKKSSEEKTQTREREIEQARIKGTKPPLPLEAYAGTYFDNAYGTVQVREENGSLVLEFPGAAMGDLKHWHYDLFRLYLRAPDPLPMFVTFSLDQTGKVQEMRIEGVADFKRVQEVGTN